MASQNQTRIRIIMRATDSNYIQEIGFVPFSQFSHKPLSD